MLKLLVIPALIFSLAIHASDQETTKLPLLASPIRTAVNRKSKPYTFYYRLKDHDYTLLESKDGCCARTKYFINNDPVTKKEYKAALLNQQYAATLGELAYIQKFGTKDPDMKLSLLLSKDFYTRKLLVELFNEAHPSCCAIS